MVCLCCFDKTQNDVTCVSTVNGSMKQEVLSSHDIRLGSSFRRVVRYLASSIKQIIHQGFLVILGIVHRFLQLASACRIQCSEPCKEFFPEDTLGFEPFLLSAFRIFYKVFLYKRSCCSKLRLFQQGSVNHSA